MWGLLLLLGFAELPERPPAVENECPLALPLTAGKAPPDGLLAPETGLVACSAVAVPTSQTAYLLQMEAWAEGQHALGLPAEREPAIFPVTAAAVGFSAGVLTALLVGGL